MSRSLQPLPARPRNQRFALTPLADAMFQLLIFFMLTSSLTPYSLATLRGGPTETVTENAAPQFEDTNASTQAAVAANGPKTTIWSLGDGVVIVDEQIYESSQLSELAKAIGTQSNPGKIKIVVGDLARVQDVATAIEALAIAEVTTVQIVRNRQ